MHAHNLKLKTISKLILILEARNTHLDFKLEDS